MKGLTTDLLRRAARIFLALAYPDGNIPAAKRGFLELRPEEPLAPLLAPPVCQPIPDPDGGVRGYSFRLGSAWFPHLKLQAVDCGESAPVFLVDTHDAMMLDPGHPDAARWAQIQADNRRLKQRVEHAWEQEGLKTFNALLRAGLGASCERAEGEPG